MSNIHVWSSWLKTAEEMQRLSPEPLQFFCAIEMDARGLSVFEPLINRLQEINGEYWTYTFDDRRTSITTKNRIAHLNMGQNLVSEFCTSDPSVNYLLFMAADCMPPADAIPKLLELNHPLVGGEVTTYCLKGPVVSEFHPISVQEHMATAAFIFIHRSVFKQLRWRSDPDLGMTDDPSYHYDAKTLLNIPTYVRKDVVGKHYPEAVGAIETRGYDMKVVRDQ